MSKIETTHGRDDGAEYDVKIPQRAGDKGAAGKVAAALKRWAKRVEDGQAPD